MAAPLEGRRVLVTRAAHQAGKLSDGLRALGAKPVEVPVLEIRPPLDCGPLDAAIRNLNAYDWLVFTSANTVRALVERTAALGISPGSAGNSSKDLAFKNGSEDPVLKGHNLNREDTFPKVAAIGESTATAARNAGFAVALVPPDYVAESLIANLADQMAGKKILLARAEIARDVIPDALRAAGARVDVVDAYRNILPEAAPPLLRAALGKGIDAVLFTSSSSVTHLAEAARAAGIPFPFAGVPAISIGPITSATLREGGWEPAAEASPSDIPGLVAAVAQHFGGM